MQMYPPELWLDTASAPPGEAADYDTELAAWDALLDAIPDDEPDEGDGASGPSGADPYEHCPSR